MSRFTCFCICAVVGVGCGGQPEGSFELTYSGSLASAGLNGSARGVPAPLGRDVKAQTALGSMQVRLNGPGATVSTADGDALPTLTLRGVMLELGLQRPTLRFELADGSAEEGTVEWHWKQLGFTAA